jgi:hypothetical protein
VFSALSTVFWAWFCSHNLSWIPLVQPPPPSSLLSVYKEHISRLRSKGGRTFYSIPHYLSLSLLHYSVISFFLALLPIPPAMKLPSTGEPDEEKQFRSFVHFRLLVSHLVSFLRESFNL